MSLEDYLKRQHSPDDIEDLKEFSEAIHKAMTPYRADRLVEHFVVLSLRLTHMLDELKGYDPEKVERAFCLTCMVQIFKFLKRNESAVKSLMSLGESGDSFLNDIYND